MVVAGGASAWAWEMGEASVSFGWKKVFTHRCEIVFLQDKGLHMKTEDTLVACMLVTYPRGPVEGYSRRHRVVWPIVASAGHSCLPFDTRRNVGGVGSLQSGARHGCGQLVEDGEQKFNLIACTCPKRVDKPRVTLEVMKLRRVGARQPDLKTAHQST